MKKAHSPAKPRPVLNFPPLAILAPLVDLHSYRPYFNTPDNL